MEKQSNNHLLTIGEMSKSIALFSGGSYSVALALIENVIPHTSQPHVFHWWRQAVELTSKAEYAIKKAMPDSNPDEKAERIRDIVTKSVNAYFSQQYADAEQYFSKLSYHLPDVQEIKRTYEELLDVLRILQIYTQAESKRKQASDEDAKAQSDLYTVAMEYYKQARLMALTVPSVLLPEAISPASLEESLNETKVLSKAAKGRQYFKKGQLQSAVDVWRDGFRLDPDHPELMDFVLSAASGSVENGAPDAASMLLDIIPMSGYSLPCMVLRKKINDAKQKQVEQNELPSNSEAISEKQTPLPLENPKDKEADSEMSPARFIISLPSPSFMEKQKELIDIGNKMDRDERGMDLTIERLSGYVREVKKILGVDQNDFKEDRERFAKNQKRLQDAEKLFEKAFHAPLEAREAIVEELWNLKLVGNKDRFENELGLDVLHKVKNARGLNTSFLQLLQRLQKQYRDDPVFMNYINLEMEKFKKDVVEKILMDSTFLSSLDPRFLRELKTQWPRDESVSRAFHKLKQALPKKPKDWSIERLRKLAHLCPAECKKELDYWRNQPFVILEYDDEIKEIDQQIEKMPVNISQELNRAFSLGTVNAYKEKIEGIFQLYYGLDGTVDEYVELYKELKGIKG